MSATCLSITAPLINTQGLAVEIVSDSIVITQPARGNGLGILLPFVCWLSSLLSYEGLFIRGGIARGLHSRKRTHLGFDFLASEALIKAYTLEHDRAKFPRVLIQNDLIDSLPNEERRLILRENNDFIVDFAHHVINREANTNNVSDVQAEMLDLHNEVRVLAAQLLQLSDEKSKHACIRIQENYQWVLDYYYWTIQQNSKWNAAAFMCFSSGVDRGFERLES